MRAWLATVAWALLLIVAPTAASARPAISSDASATSLPTPQFRRYGVASGLPSGPVYSVAQDNNGLMWFASARGIVRYDGVDFKVFRHVSGDANSMPADPIYALFVSRDNRIWAGGIASGLTVYDQRTGRFQRWEHDDARAESLGGNEVWSIAQTVDGAMWVATQAGLDRMHPDGKGFEHVPLDNSGNAPASFGPVRALLADADGSLWIGTGHGVYRRLPNGVILPVTIDPAFVGNANKVWSIDGVSGDVRIAVDGGLLQVGLDGVAHPLAGPQLADLRVLSSARDRQGRLWIGASTGLLLGSGSGSFKLIAGQPLLPGGLPDSKTWHVMLDREGGLWTTFEGSSVAYLPARWDGFARYTHIPDDPESLSASKVSALTIAGDGQLWVAGDSDFIDKLDLSTGTVRHLVKGVKNQAAALAEDTRGRLWLAVSGGLKMFEHGKLIDVDIARAGMSRPVFLEAGPAGRVYVASWGEGVFQIDPADLAIAKIPFETSVDDALLPSQLTVHKGQLWYSSAAGLLHMDKDGAALAFVPGVARHEVRAFAFDAFGFWVATEGSLEHYAYADGKAVLDARRDISKQDFAASLQALLVDSQNHLWIFANPGLFEFDPSTHQFTSFGPGQGLLDAQFVSAATSLAADGTVFAPSESGVIAFRPDRLGASDTQKSPPPVSLTGLRVRRGKDIVGLPLDGRKVVLGWRDRDLRVDARVASYTHPAANRYGYLLRGYDSGWVTGDSRGERDFAGLPAGDYVLEVCGAAEDGPWGHLATPVSIHVEAPPWMRWWAWLGYALLVLAAASLTLRNWRRRLAQRHHMQLVEQQRQMAEAASAAKTQFLATLSHEIRTPMTGVMGMAELLLGTPLNPLQHDYTQAMRRSGTMLLKLLNDALDLARIEAGKLELEPSAFDPRQLLEDVAQLEQGLAHSRGLRFALEVADDLPPQLAGDALRIKQVLLNLANNALKFTEQGSVTLRACRIDGGLQFSIIDTGPGIPEASQARLFQRFEQAEGPQRQAGSGLGLAICRELVDMMGGSIELESRLGHGSTFHVRLPLVEPAVPALLPSEVVPADRCYRLLLVEDDTIVAAVIRGLLERDHHHVVHVVNGLAALAELTQSAFDALLLDLDLPGVDGFQIARLIRQREHAEQHLPIIAVTARSGSDDEALARAAGMDGFLHKPLTGEQLATALGRVIASETPASG
ncbi:two-component regulator propeller domain-containing protein [Rhodanobacter sp. AS-Z3]|uniref:hybrid sensor histidine kinase/response regulator n=1 Tax=Rhodanobacter sp. AS-Z3 TaxID=3031330 RepID=UPI002478C73C|nr:hybrid sensor histidine kinase/response regulator [Rhodanobacter sp. AS-Z3]WEN16172.1 two-component regulator propeller domain-containing protein [Rhodanobacter sp. AS-Z3]